MNSKQPHNHPEGATCEKCQQSSATECYPFHAYQGVREFKHPANKERLVAKRYNGLINLSAFLCSECVNKHKRNRAMKLLVIVAVLGGAWVLSWLSLSNFGYTVLSGVISILTFVSTLGVIVYVLNEGLLLIPFTRAGGEDLALILYEKELNQLGLGKTGRRHKHSKALVSDVHEELVSLGVEISDPTTVSIVDWNTAKEIPCSAPACNTPREEWEAKKGLKTIERLYRPAFGNVD